MLGSNFSCLCCHLLTFLKINFQKILSGTLSVSNGLVQIRTHKLFAKVYSRWQKSPLARKQLKTISSLHRLGQLFLVFRIWISDSPMCISIYGFQGKSFCLDPTLPPVLTAHGGIWFYASHVSYVFVYQSQNVNVNEQYKLLWREPTIFEGKIVNTFLPINFNMLWVLKRTVTLRQFFWVPTT